MIEIVAYGGWKHCLRLSNREVELLVTLDVGPRVIRFGFVGGQNLLKEFPEEMGKTAGDKWLSFGGHRLWHAPEVDPRTYAPDFDPVEWSAEGECAVRLTQQTEPSTGIRKRLRIELDPARNHVRLDHALVNRNLWAVELAPWCLSVMAPGGVAVIPQEDYVPHGSGPGETFDPARPLVLWPYTSMADPRFAWGEKFIQFRQDDAYPSKQKIGVANSKGWAAYRLRGEVFIKKFPYDAQARYPDFGCNCESFTMPGFLEVETLGPLARLEPGAEARHRETWGLYRKDVGGDEAALCRELLPLVADVPGCGD